MSNKKPILYRIKLRNGEVYNYYSYGRFFSEHPLWTPDDFYYYSRYWRNGEQIRIYKEH